MHVGANREAEAGTGVAVGMGSGFSCWGKVTSSAGVWHLGTY